MSDCQLLPFDAFADSGHVVTQRYISDRLECEPSYFEGYKNIWLHHLDAYLLEHYNGEFEVDVYGNTGVFNNLRDAQWHLYSAHYAT